MKYLKMLLKAFGILVAIYVGSILFTIAVFVCAAIANGM
jgi:hypothetical protein